MLASFFFKACKPLSKEDKESYWGILKKLFCRIKKPEPDKLLVSMMILIKNSEPLKLIYLLDASEIRVFNFLFITKVP